MSRSGSIAAAGVAAMALVACSSSSNLAPESERASEQTARDSAFCDEARLQSRAPAPDPFGTDLTPTEVDAALAETRNRLDALAAVAPEALEDDIGRVVAAFARLDELLADHDYDLDAMDAAGVEVPFASDPDFADIGERIARHLTDQCGIER